MQLGRRRHPIKALATGGRNVITHEGDMWDNYQVIYTYPNDVHVSFSSTQFGGQSNFDVSERVFGAEGLAEIPYSGPLRIIGENAWRGRTRKARRSAAPARFAANGAFTDNLIRATATKTRASSRALPRPVPQPGQRPAWKVRAHCMLGRMAGYTGRETTWDELEKDHESWELGIDMKQFS